MYDEEEEVIPEIEGVPEEVLVEQEDEAECLNPNVRREFTIEEMVEQVDHSEDIDIFNFPSPTEYAPLMMSKDSNGTIQPR